MNLEPCYNFNISCRQTKMLFHKIADKCKHVAASKRSTGPKVDQWSTDRCVLSHRRRSLYHVAQATDCGSICRSRRLDDTLSTLRYLTLYIVGNSYQTHIHC